MPIFYHLSKDIKHNGKFYPRIPSYRHEDSEDNTISRVSVATSIEECFTAIPGGSSNLDILNINNRGYYLIFCIDTDKLGIKEEDMVSNDELFKKDLVRDADITNEYWITVPFEVPKEDRFIIKLYAWEEVTEDLIPYSIYQIADEKYEGDYLKAYVQECNSDVPYVYVIKDLIYTSEKVNKREKISIYFEDDEEMSLVERYLKEHYYVEITKKIVDEIEFEVKEDTNLRKLFLYHSSILVDS